MPHSAQWERVEAAIRGEPVDRAPFGFWMHVPEIDRDPEKLAFFTVDLTRRYRMDYVKVMFRSSWGLEDWGAAFDTFHPARGYWLPAGFVVQRPEDWAALKPLPPDRGAAVARPSKSGGRRASARRPSASLPRATSLAWPSACLP